MPVKVVAHPVSNLVITPSATKPEYGTFRVDSEQKTFINGFMNNSKRSAFIRGKIVDLNTLGLTAGKVMPGQIIKEESFSPFYDNQSPKINPTTAEVVLKDGRESYIQYVYTTDMSASDTWIGETNVVLSAEAQNALASQQV